MLALSFKGVRRIGDDLFDIRARGGAHRCRQRPFNQWRGAKPHFPGNARVEKIQRRFRTEQGTADVHHHQHVVGISNRLDRLHHLDRVGTDGVLRIVDTGGNGDFTVAAH